jgi:transposase
MPKAYSDDLRTKFLEAYAAGQSSLEQLCRQFGVSFGWGKKVRRQQIQTGDTVRPEQSRHGPKGLLTPEIEQFLLAALAVQPDLTLAELTERLHKAHQVRISPSRLWYWLRGLGLCHKKNAASQGTGSGRESVAAKQLAGAVRRDRSRVSGFPR